MGKRLVPNQSGWFVPHTQEYFTWIDVNSHRLPDVEHTYDNLEGKYRILFLGDSFVENTQVPLEKRFFRQIQSAYPDKEVIAMGVGNTGTAQQLVMLREYGVKYHPNLVVHMFLTANDVKNNSPVLQNDPYQPYFDENLEYIPPKLRTDRPLGKLKENLKKIRLIEFVLSVRHRYLTQKNNHSDGYPLDYGVYTENYSDQYQKAWETTKKLILASRSEALAAGAKYVLVVLTNNEQIQQNVWQEALTTYPEMQSERFDLEKPDKLLAEFCDQEELECYFMLPYFKSYVADHPGEITHNHFEGHWNQTGTDLAAKFLIEKLKDLFPNDVAPQN